MDGTILPHYTIKLEFEGPNGNFYLYGHLSNNKTRTVVYIPLSGKYGEPAPDWFIAPKMGDKLYSKGCWFPLKRVIIIDRKTKEEVKVYELQSIRIKNPNDHENKIVIDYIDDLEKKYPYPNFAIQRNKQISNSIKHRPDIMIFKWHDGQYKLLKLIEVKKKHQSKKEFKKTVNQLLKYKKMTQSTDCELEILFESENLEQSDLMMASDNQIELMSCYRSTPEETYSFKHFTMANINN
jgi:hypothetical protein